MLMNFGPINQRGGEKRLNVIFSRARHRMAVVSSIRAEAITNTHNDGAAALRAFLQYAEANSRGEAERSQSVLTGLNPVAQRAFASAPPPDAVRSALAEALRGRGHAVREHVGRSRFRCDLAVLSADGRHFELGILLDGDAGEAAAREAHVFRPAILRAFGWRVMDLPTIDWVRNPDGVIAGVEQRLRADWDDADLDEPYVAQAFEPPASPPAPTPAAAPATVAPSGETRAFRFRQGTSDKFWRITTDGCDVTVAFGRAGTQGQKVLKSFDNPARAEREAAKLIDEKLRKGYEEADLG
jgi:predicted DNA-binding WGR domain protein